MISGEQTVVDLNDAAPPQNLFDEGTLVSAMHGLSHGRGYATLGRLAARYFQVIVGSENLSGVCS